MTVAWKGLHSNKLSFLRPPPVPELGDVKMSSLSSLTPVQHREVHTDCCLEMWRIFARMWVCVVGELRLTHISS